MIRVLIVEDSPTVGELLTRILESDPAVEVVGIARDGADAVESLRRLRPSVVTMDVRMPRLDGFEATRRIMESDPVPVVIVSATCEPEAADTAFRAMEAGALAVLQTPPGIGHPQFEDAARKLLETVKLMAEVKVVRRWARARPQPAAAMPPPAAGAPVVPREIRCVAVGASTGGPPALRALLSALPPDFPAPILVVQHIAPGFLPSMTAWLGRTTGLPVDVAADGQQLLPAHVCFAPDRSHLGVRPDGRVKLSGEEPVNGVRPSVSYLFDSVGAVFGRHAIGVLLTGMGRDGAAELRGMKERGAITIVQDEQSSTVYGMPGEAARLGGATHITPLDDIAGLLVGLARLGVKERSVE